MSKLFVNFHRHGIASKLVRVNQAAGEFVVGVRRQTIVYEERGFGIERFAVTLYQTVDFRPSRLRPCDRVGPRESRDILSKTMACNKAVKVISLEAEAGEVIPASHVLAWGR